METLLLGHLLFLCVDFLVSLVALVFFPPFSLKFKENYPERKSEIQ